MEYYINIGASIFSFAIKSMLLREYAYILAHWILSMLTNIAKQRTIDEFPSRSIDVAFNLLEDVWDHRTETTGSLKFNKNIERYARRQRKMNIYRYIRNYKIVRGKV